MDNKRYHQRKVVLAEGKKIIGLKSMAYNDYIAARNLLNCGLFHQAEFFINTCIEKELKAYLFAHNIKVKFSHDTVKLLKSIIQIESIDWINEINSEFIDAINNIYSSRYFEKLEPGYNFVINRNKFLAELDFTYSFLESKTLINLINNDELNLSNSRFQESINNKNPLIFLNNYILNNIPKDDFLRKPDIVYEFRITSIHQAIQGEYIIPKNIDLNKFNYEGLRQNSNESFTLSQWVEGSPNAKMRLL